MKKNTAIDKYNQSPFLILKTAYLYYMQNKSQSDIAEDLSISITTVSRLLNKAKEQKIIEFVIRDPYLKCIELEQKLKECYRLKEVIIAPNGINDELDGTDTELAKDNAKRLVALEGARYLQRIIRPDDILGVTWGSTVYNMINYLNPAQKIPAKFVTLHGSIACCENELDVRTLVSRMAKAFFGKNYYLLTDALMSSSAAVDIMKKERNNREVFQMFDTISISVNGIGSFYPEESSVLATQAFMETDDLQSLRNAGAYGDIALRFFDADGNECKSPLSERMIAISIDQLKRIPQKIALASGVHKAYSVRAALRGGLIDVLIIDYQLAQKLIELADTEKRLIRP